jgi:copper(I)-binding protein
MSVERRKVLLTSAVLLMGCAIGLMAPLQAASAHEYEVGKLKIEHPWLRTPKEGEANAPLFMHIENKGDAPDKLIGVKSEKIGKVVLHADPKFIVMPHGIVIPAHASVKLEPGGPYADLREVKKMNPVGWGYELILVFEKAGEVTVDAAVEAPDAKHAHDAEATERWEKAHAAPGGPTPSGQEMHHDMNHEKTNSHMMDHGMEHGGAPASPPAPEAK